ncbi:MAG: phosphatase PAP2 family protein [Chloroflexota bacterium]|nr:phosphatase PAP2 family protein [Chloroflexota bacterium]
MLADADKALFLWINALVGHAPVIDAMMSRLASDYLVPVGMGLTLVALWFVGSDDRERMRYQIGMFTALTAMALSSLVVFICNALFFRPRPFDGLDDVSLLFYMPTDSSFPSNSAAVAFAIAAGVWCINRRLGVVLFVAAAVYGFSRIYVGVHYPADILGGAVIAVIVTALTLRLRDLLMPLLVGVIKAARLFAIA